jgi:hypothetical protein
METVVESKAKPNSGSDDYCGVAEREGKAMEVWDYRNSRA